MRGKHVDPRITRKKRANPGYAIPADTGMT